MKINYHNRVFRVAGKNEDVTHFHYFQDGDVVWGTYEGGGVTKGTLIAKVNENGVLNMHYHHLNANMEFKLGKCVSVPRKNDAGRIEIHEQYESVGTEKVSKGEIILVEVN